MVLSGNNVLFDQVLEQVYDASTGMGWGGAIEAIRHATNSAASSLFFQDRAEPTRQITVIETPGYPDHAAHDYTNHYGALSVRMPAVLKSHVGEIYVDDRTMPFSQITSSVIYNEFYRPLDLAYCMACTLFRENERSSHVSLHRSHASGNFLPTETQFFERLAPHLVRALQLQRLVEQAKALTGGLRIALDHFQTAAVLVDGAARVVHANAAADTLLCRTESPFRLAGGRLTTNRPSEAARFQQLVALSSDPLGKTAPIGSFMDSDGNVVSVMGAPVRRLGWLDVGPTSLAILFIAEPNHMGPLKLDRLAQQFGLSAAEAAVAALVFEGLSIENIAFLRAVSRETIRSQLKSVLNKMDLNTQSQLVGVLSRSLAHLRHAQR